MDDSVQTKLVEIQDQLRQIIEWAILPKLGEEEQYKLTIAYDGYNSSQIIKVLGRYPKDEICEKIINFFYKFLSEEKSFGLLITSENDFVRNWEIELKK